jgi:hypothetical protein
MALSVIFFGLGLGSESLPSFNLLNKEYFIVLDAIFFSAFALGLAQIR